MVGAGDWQSLEDGRCWRMVGAGEWQALEKFRGQRNLRCWRNVRPRNVGA